MKNTLLRYISVLALVFNLTACGYNDIQLYDETVNSAWAEVQNQYMRRADLIPNLVASVKGYSLYEKDVLESVTKARADVIKSTTALANLPSDPQLLRQWQQSQQNLSHVITQFMVVSERYPDLKANMLYQNMMTQLEGTENRIAVARGRYIKALQQYNVTIRQFPAVVTARIMSYQPKVSQLPSDDAKIMKTPIVDFSMAPAH
ncbi:lemA family protein [Yersinia rohdei]|uniref:LemA family protein n=1 Tax=Yersinia rohdei TaxID=29485 RepID=A0ABN4EXD1_YERRO|nr:LemA family protein [Yersinia rohdei]AJJ09076.1 lemA family protein [Yersinia rohdei]EEQ02317.1 LemA family protein [Yersinia rohdei ATCC 43380]